MEAILIHIHHLTTIWTHVVKYNHPKCLDTTKVAV